MHVSTVRRYLNREGLQGRVPRRKPLLKPIHKKRWLEFAREHIDDAQVELGKMLWSDETKLELSATNDHSYVWRKSGEALLEKNIVPTVKHGGGSIILYLINTIFNVYHVSSYFSHYSMLLQATIIKYNINMDIQNSYLAIRTLALLPILSRATVY